MHEKIAELGTAVLAVVHEVAPLSLLAEVEAIAWTRCLQVSLNASVDERQVTDECPAIGKPPFHCTLGFAVVLIVVSEFKRQMALR